MTKRYVARAIVLIAGLMGGCVGGEGSAGSGRVLLSDGTAAGDLIEEQMRNSDHICSCISEPSLDQWCFDLTWPAGQATCMRDSMHAHELANLDSLRCYIRVYEEFNACLVAAACVEEPHGACLDQFVAAEDACPTLTEAAAFDMRRNCFPDTDNWPNEE